MTTKEATFEYLLRLGDNALILGHRLSEWCGHGPVLEQDIAMTNIALDQVGQARSLLQYAAQIEGEGRTEDQLAYTRDVMQFRNLLLVEQPNENFAHTIVRQFFFDAFNFPLYQGLARSKDEHLKAIAEKSLKEITYHLRYSSEWVIRLGDGTPESHKKMQDAVDELIIYTGELTTADEVDLMMAEAGIAPALEQVHTAFDERLNAVLQEATLNRPKPSYMQSGGKDGRMHTEYLGYILAELQFVQRAYPNMEW
ncbi:1,2-phenylacetyl-CoA epoxidase subunit PaaC [Phaeodactylibacter luteus]|uniref:Phenylacetate-CoA oxygenase subunit PaaC n=1 Tax=Phaeodactylibacter luteus TaxID=1564516 RepID=A0A5C6RZY3_9BACT|nr:1,2-phenylacetyl-CoA epoxidase subunit PaaC [Phaeodactylibacter luteus]TXB67555.1 phenylacetate-CoA oxygenase subunit PaaC [Phaeodactylibacter luteus]